jgi:hypothetical protein
MQCFERARSSGGRLVSEGAVPRPWLRVLSVVGSSTRLRRVQFILEKGLGLLTASDHTIYVAHKRRAGQGTGRHDQPSGDFEPTRLDQVSTAWNANRLTQCSPGCIMASSLHPEAPRFGYAQDGKAIMLSYRMEEPQLSGVDHSNSGFLTTYWISQSPLDLRSWSTWASASVLENERKQSRPDHHAYWYLGYRRHDIGRRTPLIRLPSSPKSRCLGGTMPKVLFVMTSRMSTPQRAHCLHTWSSLNCYWSRTGFASSRNYPPSQIMSCPEINDT